MKYRVRRWLPTAPGPPFLPYSLAGVERCPHTAPSFEGRKGARPVEDGRRLRSATPPSSTTVIAWNGSDRYGSISGMIDWFLDRSVGRDSNASCSQGIAFGYRMFPPYCYCTHWRNEQSIGPDLGQRSRDRTKRQAGTLPAKLFFFYCFGSLGWIGRRR